MSRTRRAPREQSRTPPCWYYPTSGTPHNWKTRPSLHGRSWRYGSAQMTGSSGPVWEPDKVNNRTAPQRERPAVGDGSVRSVAGGNGRRQQAGRWRGFVGRYGWRAYALPFLVVITVLALFTTN